jgi:Potato inhibitor I family
MQTSNLLFLVGLLLQLCATMSSREPTIAQWPELVGKSGEEAKITLAEHHPALKVFVIPQSSMVTMDYNVHRVRLFVDDHGVITQVPRVG